LQAKGDDKVDRALAQMMGGSLAGETVEGKLDQVIPGLLFKPHRRVHHSTLAWREIRKKKKDVGCLNILVD